jgi:hypothetical protein
LVPEQVQMTYLVPEQMTYLVPEQMTYLVQVLSFRQVL